MTAPKYCCQCATPLVKHTPPGDHLPRLQCPACHFIVYENPKILVSCFATWGKKVLWMRRATQPYCGSWAIPSGFLEVGESLQAGAARELFEETGARIDVENMQLYTIGSLVRMNQIYVVFRAPLLSTDFHTTDEASEVVLFGEDEFPWQDFAFPEVDINVKQFYRELGEDCFQVYVGTLENGQNIVNACEH